MCPAGTFAKLGGGDCLACPTGYCAIASPGWPRIVIPLKIPSTSPANVISAGVFQVINPHIVGSLRYPELVLNGCNWSLLSLAHSDPALL